MNAKKLTFSLPRKNYSQICTAVKQEIFWKVIDFKKVTYIYNSGGSWRLSRKGFLTASRKVEAFCISRGQNKGAMGRGT